jgi:hypothetical protein
MPCAFLRALWEGLPQNIARTVGRFFRCSKPALPTPLPGDGSS